VDFCRMDAAIGKFDRSNPLALSPPPFAVGPLKASQLPNRATGSDRFDVHHRAQDLEHRDQYTTVPDEVIQKSQHRSSWAASSNLEDDPGPPTA